MYIQCPTGGYPIGIVQKFSVLGKLEWLGCQILKKKYDDTLSHFHTIPKRDGQTDGWAELLYQYRASALLCLCMKQWQSIGLCRHTGTKCRGHHCRSTWCYFKNACFSRNVLKTIHVQLSLWSATVLLHRRTAAAYIIHQSSSHSTAVRHLMISANVTRTKCDIQNHTFTQNAAMYRDFFDYCTLYSYFLTYLKHCRHTNNSSSRYKYTCIL